MLARLVTCKLSYSIQPFSDHWCVVYVWGGKVIGWNNSEGARVRREGCICCSLIRRGHRSWCWATHSTEYGCSASASVRPFITITYNVKILVLKHYLLWEFEANKLLPSRRIKPRQWSFNAFKHKFISIKLWKPCFCLAENITFPIIKNSCLMLLVINAM